MQKMDVSSQSDRSLSSVVSRLQKNDRLPEETRSSAKQETRIEPCYRNDDLLITPDPPSKCADPSEAGLSPVSQYSLYPEQSVVETQNELVHDWAAKETGPTSEVNTTVTKETGPASEVNTTVTKETGPASEVSTTVTKETGSASEVTTDAKQTDPASEATTGIKETDPASEATTGTKETDPASEVTTGIRQTDPASEVTTGIRQTDPASEVTTGIRQTDPASEVTTGTNETGAASEFQTPIQPIQPSEADRDAETVVEANHIFLHDGEARIFSDDEERLTDTETEAEREDGTDEEDGCRVGFASTVNFGDVTDFEMDDLLDDSSDEELPTLQEIYQRCQTIRNKRFYADLYNVWQRKIQEDEREDAIKILSASGFGKSGPDEIGDGLDKALSLVPERFWRNDSSANDISIEDLKMIVEERKDAEERAQYREYCQAAEAGSKSGGQARLRRSAIATGGGQSSAILHNYLKMNLLKSHVPMYYFPSYLQRFKEATKTDPESESESEEENSDDD